MSEPTETAAESRSGINREVVIFVVALVALGLSWWMGEKWMLLLLISEAVVIAIVIAQACDPFADAAQWIGETFRIPGSIRGATIDAVASSIPELFSGIFFVLLAFSATGDGQSVEQVVNNTMKSV